MTGGCFVLIYGIPAVASSHVFTAGAHDVSGSLNSWGWITLIIGVLRPLAAAGVLTGSQPARWFAVAVLALNALGQVFFSPACPCWSVMIIAVDVAALYGPRAYGSHANLAALSVVRKNVAEGRRSWCGLTSGPYRSRGPGAQRGLRADVAVDGAAPLCG